LIATTVVVVVIVAVVVAERLPVGGEVESRVVGQVLLIAAVDVDREDVLVSRTGPPR
jgi:hypothetical protein